MVHSEVGHVVSCVLVNWFISSGRKIMTITLKQGNMCENDCECVGLAGFLCFRVLWYENVGSKQKVREFEVKD